MDPVPEKRPTANEIKKRIRNLETPPMSISLTPTSTSKTNSSDISENSDSDDDIPLNVFMANMRSTNKKRARTTNKKQVHVTRNKQPDVPQDQFDEFPVSKRSLELIESTPLPSPVTPSVQKQSSPKIQPRSPPVTTPSTPRQVSKGLSTPQPGPTTPSVTNVVAVTPTSHTRLVCTRPPFMLSTPPPRPTLTQSMNRMTSTSIMMCVRPRLTSFRPPLGPRPTLRQLDGQMSAITTFRFQATDTRYQNTNCGW